LTLIQSGDRPEGRYAGRGAQRNRGEQRISAMSTLTRRQAIKCIGIGTSLASGMRPRSLLAQARTQLFIGTAGKGGVFYPLGTATAGVISKYASELDAIASETNGTAENMKLLQEGKIELALAQADIAWAATQGRLNGLRKMVPVRNLLGTHATYLHLVTLAGRGIEAVEDLIGKRVSTGLAGSATDIKALRVLQAHGVTPYNLGTHEHLDYLEAAQALKDGKLDAFAADAALPMPALLELAAAPGVGLRLIPTGDAVSKITAKHGPFYFAAPIPKGTYPGIDADVSAAAGATLFVAHESMEESLAYEIKVLLERTREVASACEMVKEISSTSAVRGSSIPFHPGALRYYKETGVTVPQS
jgi:TRAP transporter TAXI family solute receptor